MKKISLILILIFSIIISSTAAMALSYTKYETFDNSGMPDGWSDGGGFDWDYTTVVRQGNESARSNSAYVGVDDLDSVSTVVAWIYSEDSGTVIRLYNENDRYTCGLESDGVYIRYYTGTFSEGTKYNISLNTWYYLYCQYTSSDKTIVINLYSQNGTLLLNDSRAWTTGTPAERDKLAVSGGYGIIDHWRMWAGYIGDDDEVPFLIEGIPVLSNMNCTSCDPPTGDTTKPYTTSDTTPTFKFDTDVNANCRIADENLNYTTMGASRNCTIGDGNVSHSCILTVDDELIYSTDYVYISCENSFDNNQTSNASVELEMEITDLEDNATSAIQRGIEDSSIWPEATVYSNQQVYLRDLNNNQLLATVDKVAVYGNQRWIFNYVLSNESKLGLFNITPAVYVLDMQNITLTDIEDDVTELINNTVN